MAHNCVTSVHEDLGDVLVQSSFGVCNVGHVFDDNLGIKVSQKCNSEAKFYFPNTSFQLKAKVIEFISNK